MDHSLREFSIIYLKENSLQTKTKPKRTGSKNFEKKIKRFVQIKKHQNWGKNKFKRTSSGRSKHPLKNKKEN